MRLKYMEESAGQPAGIFPKTRTAADKCNHLAGWAKLCIEVAGRKSSHGAATAYKDVSIFRNLFSLQHFVSIFLVRLQHTYDLIIDSNINMCMQALLSQLFGFESCPF